VVMWGLVKALREDVTKRDTHTQLHLAPRHGGPTTLDWQRRLRNLTTYPRRRHIQRFMEEVVTPALEEVAAALTKQGANTTVEQTAKQVALHVEHDSELDFVYKVRPEAYPLPAFVENDE